MIQFSSHQCGVVLQEAIAYLKDAGTSSAELDARLLLQRTLQQSREFLIREPSFLCSTAQLDAYAHLLERRFRHEPIAKIIGEKEFWGISFMVNDKVLDPRPDSETLIEAVLAQFKDHNSPYRILDLGVGSGCLLLSLLHEYEHATGIGVDISADALTVVEHNAEALGFGERVQFLCMSWGEDLIDQFDIIISNPPYIPRSELATLSPEVNSYDPTVALDGGEDGLDCYRLLAPIVSRLLNANGFLFVEIGQGQEKEVAFIFGEGGLTCQEWRCDLQGIKRCGVFSRVR